MKLQMRHVPFIKPEDTTTGWHAHNNLSATTVPLDQKDAGLKMTTRSITPKDMVMYQVKRT